MRKKPDSLCTSKIIFALSLGLCFLGITSALTIPNQKAEHKPFFEGIKIVVSGDNNNEKVEKTGENKILLFSNGIVNGDLTKIGERTQKQMTNNAGEQGFSSIFGGYGQVSNDNQSFFFGGVDNQTDQSRSYEIGGTQGRLATKYDFLIGGFQNGDIGNKGKDYMIVGGIKTAFNGSGSINIISQNDQNTTENSLIIHNNQQGDSNSNNTTIKNTFFYNNQANNAKNDNAAEFYSENGLQINTASSVSGITINAGGSFQMVPKDINDEKNEIRKPCNASRNGLYEVVYSGGETCVFYCNGHDWKDAFPGEVRYTGTNGTTETRQNKCTGRLKEINPSKGDCIISGGIVLANGMTAKLYQGKYPQCEEFTGTCISGQIMNGRSKPNPNEVRHICEAATGRCQATTEQRENQLIDENAIPCAGINFSRPGSGSIYLTGTCPTNPAANTCPYHCKEGYKPYDNGSGTKCEEVFKIVFTGTSVTTGEIIFAGRKEIKNFIYAGQTRTGYTFTGWKNFSTTDAINTKGKFKRKGDGSINGGTEVDSGNVEYYYNTMGDFDEKYHLTGEYILTLSGLWEPNTYTIQFNLSGGQGKSDPITCNYDNIQYNYDALYRLTSTPSLHCNISAYNTPTKTGYTFVGWEIQGMDTGLHLLYNHEKCQGESIAKLDKTYSEKFTDDGTEIKCVKNLTATNKGSITFIAHWRPNKLIVNYYGNGADYAYTGKSKLSPQDPTEKLPGSRSIQNPHELLWTGSVVWNYPPDYALGYGFGLTKSGYQPNNTYEVYSGENKSGKYLKSIPQALGDSNTKTNIPVSGLAYKLEVLPALEKGDVTVSLYAGWKPCDAGWYCPANQQPTECPIGMKSQTGSSAITQCYTTCEAGYYLPAKSGTCAQCENGYYCPNEKKYYYSGSNDQGKYSCVDDTESPLYTGSDGNRTSIYNCYMNIPCGKYKTSNNTIEGCGEYKWSSDHISHYGKSDNSCKNINDSQSSGYYANSSCSNQNQCNNKPENSHYTSNGTSNNNCKWGCDRGYEKQNNQCIKKTARCGNSPMVCAKGVACADGPNTWLCLGPDAETTDVKCKYTPEKTHTTQDRTACGAKHPTYGCKNDKEFHVCSYIGSVSASGNLCGYRSSNTTTTPASVSQIDSGDFICSKWRLNFRINGYWDKNGNEYQTSGYDIQGNWTHVDHVVIAKGAKAGHDDYDGEHDANMLKTLWEPGRQKGKYKFLGWYTSPQPYNASLGRFAGKQGYVDQGNKNLNIPIGQQITSGTFITYPTSDLYNNSINLYAWRYREEISDDCQVLATDDDQEDGYNRCAEDEEEYSCDSNGYDGFKYCKKCCPIIKRY